MKMTDSQMKKFFNSLLRDEHDFDDFSIAIGLLAAIGAFDEKLELEDEKIENRISKR